MHVWIGPIRTTIKHSLLLCSDIHLLAWGTIWHFFHLHRKWSHIPLILTHTHRLTNTYAHPPQNWCSMSSQWTVKLSQRILSGRLLRMIAHTHIYTDSAFVVQKKGKCHTQPSMMGLQISGFPTKWIKSTMSSVEIKLYMGFQGRVKHCQYNDPSLPSLLGLIADLQS